MPISDEQFGQLLMCLELVLTSKRIAAPFEDAYQWLKETQTHLDLCETIGTIAFTSNGKIKVSHLTWSDLNELHSAYLRLNNIEVLLSSRELAEDYTVRAAGNA
jgi:hypothetical protein